MRPRRPLPPCSPSARRTGRLRVCASVRSVNGHHSRPRLLLPSLSPSRTHAAPSSRRALRAGPDVLLLKLCPPALSRAHFISPPPRPAPPSASLHRASAAPPRAPSPASQILKCPRKRTPSRSICSSESRRASASLSPLQPLNSQAALLSTPRPPPKRTRESLSTGSREPARRISDHGRTRSTWRHVPGPRHQPCRSFFFALQREFRASNYHPPWECSLARRARLPSYASFLSSQASFLRANAAPRPATELTYPASLMSL